jgi:predicted deacetylase
MAAGQRGKKLIERALRWPVAAALFLFCFLGSLGAACAAPQITFYYDREAMFSSAWPPLARILRERGLTYPLAAALAEELGHYEGEVRSVALDAWQPDSRAADVAVVLCLYPGRLPDALLAEIARAKKIVWFENNIGQLANHLGWQDFWEFYPVPGWTRLSPGGVVEPWLFANPVQPGAGATVFSRVENPLFSLPFAWQRGKVYYAARLDFFNAPLRAAAANLLTLAMPQPRYDYPGAVLLRIEDVSPLTDPEGLRGVIREAEGRGIAFAIGVIALGLDGRGRSVALRERPELLRILREAQARGASIIMHGYTHQNEFSPQTGEGYEFWNSKEDKPPADEENFARARIRRAFAELVAARLYPVAFEPPHYAMGGRGYKAMAEVFNVFSGRVQISDESDRVSVATPYIGWSPRVGAIAVPENLGFCDGTAASAQAILRRADELAAIRGSFACFFYHPYLPPARLGELIDAFQARGYRFFDLRRLPVRAEAGDTRIFTRDGRLIVETSANMVH